MRTDMVGYGPRVEAAGNPYENELRKLVMEPGKFTGTPGFQFALDTGRQAIERAMSARGLGNSGNLLAELMKHGTGLASQEYGAHVDRLGRLAGQGRQFDIAERRNANDFELGTQGNALTAQRNWWDNDVNKERNAQAGADSQNRFNVDWFNANTSRSNARSNDFYRGEENRRAWTPRGRY